MWSKRQSRQDISLQEIIHIWNTSWSSGLATRWMMWNFSWWLIRCISHTFHDFLTVSKVYHHSRLLSFSLSFALLGSLDFMFELGVHWLLLGFGRAFDKLKFIKHSTRSWTVKSQTPSFFIVKTILCKTDYFRYSLLAVDF